MSLIPTCKLTYVVEEGLCKFKLEMGLRAPQQKREREGEFPRHGISALVHLSAMLKTRLGSQLAHS